MPVGGGAFKAKIECFEAGGYHRRGEAGRYEAGVEGKLRVIIEREKSECYLVLAGNHDDIRRFLKDC